MRKVDDGEKRKKRKKRKKEKKEKKKKSKKREKKRGERKIGVIYKTNVEKISVSVSLVRLECDKSWS